MARTGGKMAEQNPDVNVNVNPENGGTQPEIKTFDELLKDPNYQAEFDKKVAKAIEKSKVKWQKEEDEKRDEATKLASLDAEEKHKYELSKLQKEKDEMQAKLNAYGLRQEAEKIAKEKGMDISLLDLIDYSRETAESVKTKLDVISSSVSKSLEKTVDERLKQPNPTQVNENSGVEKEFSRASY